MLLAKIRTLNSFVRYHIHLKKQTRLMNTKHSVLKLFVSRLTLPVPDNAFTMPFFELDHLGVQFQVSNYNLL